MEWKEVRLSDIGTIVGGATPSTKNPTYYDGEIPWITPKDLTNWNDVYISKGERSITKEGYNSSSCKLMPKGTVLFTSRAPIGYIAIAANELCTNQGFKSVVPNEELVDSVFLYYALLFNKNKIKSLGSGTTFAEVSGKVMEGVVISIPELSTQKKIAAQLSEIDSKIAVNRRICENLEAQAQALFKHWFIDFAPFKEGKFVESELGMIPEGWRVVTLDEATSKFGTGLNPRKNFKLGFGNNYYVTIKNMIDNRVILDNKCDFVDDEAIKVIQKRSKLAKGDLLFSGIGTIGRVAIVVDEPLNWNTSESVFNMHPAEGFSTEFLYVLLLSKQLQNYVKINSQGAVQQGIRMASLKAYKFPYPECEIKELNLLLKDIISKKTNIEKESNILAQIRDTLLPKLMSGEIKV